MERTIDLKTLRTQLALMEDSIIFKLFSRSQFLRNEDMYIPGRVPIKDFKGSFLDYLFRGREMLDASAGRYDDHMQHPFFPDVISAAKRVVRKPDNTDDPEVKLDRNQEIKRVYVEGLSQLCRPGDDNQYGSAAELDILCLQDVSIRIHLGEYVAESKWRAESAKLGPLMKAGDWASVEEGLRDRRVENQVYERVKEKGLRYGIPPVFIGDFYVKQIIPMTVAVEVEYLQRKAERAALLP